MKKFFVVLTVLAVLAVAIPTFAAYTVVKCAACNGHGYVQCYVRFIPVINYGRDKNGNVVRIPPYQRPCPDCNGSGMKRCLRCGGKGVQYIQDTR